MRSSHNALIGTLVKVYCYSVTRQNIVQADAQLIRHDTDTSCVKKEASKLVHKSSYYSAKIGHLV